MAIYSVQVKSLSRGKGDSATAAAAYRAGLDLDDPSGARHSYSRKTGVLSVDMLAPTKAPAWALDPHQLWSKVEEHETRKNARVAREMLMALPHELTPEQRRALARDVGQLLVERYSVAVQIGLHAPDKGGDERNYHAHILMTPRQVGSTGFGDSAAKVLDEFKAGAQELKALRALIGERINDALSAASQSARVDHRSLRDQQGSAIEAGDFCAAAKLDRQPSRHEGKAVTQARRRGERLPRAKRNDRLKTAGERRFNQHSRRFEEIKAKAAAEGRLATVDEQALHARALVERRKAGAQRLQAATDALLVPTPPKAKTGVPAREVRRASLQPGSSVPKRTTRVIGHRGKEAAAKLPPQVHTRVTGNGTRESEQAAHLANLWLAQVEKDVADLIRRALAWAQNHADPLPRSLARDYLSAEGEAQLTLVVRTQAAADLKQARRARHDARYYRDQGEAGLKGKDRLAQRLGWTPRTLRDLQDAVKLTEEQAVYAKQAEHLAITAQEKATQEAEHQRQRLLQAFQKAHPTEDFRFPDQWPPVARSPATEQSPSKQPGADTGILPPRWKPPHLRRPGPR
ncbi:MULTISPECIES: MobA/MobL family protein [Stenotrophomonas]|uniref:MobA/MobL family protein n=1 Tax=Stenotrophomonas TaxID=40323 RepID=UPI002E7619FB|nr:MobA/MobL family protein [[Pseudomonas] hibiscicola]